MNARQAAARFAGKDMTIKSGQVVIDLLRFEVTVDGREVPFTPMEMKLLALFVGNPEIVFSRDEIIDFVWGKNIHIFHRSVDTHVSKVRKKHAILKECIQSMHGIGYRWEPLAAAHVHSRLEMPVVP